MGKRFLTLSMAVLLLCAFTACNVGKTLPVRTPSKATATPSNPAQETPPPSMPTSVPKQEKPKGTGSVSRTENTAQKTVTLEAIPSKDSGFIGWASDEAGDKIVSYYNPYTFDAAQEITLYPVFMQDDQIISFQDTGITDAIYIEGWWYAEAPLTYHDVRTMNSLTVWHPEDLSELAYFSALDELFIMPEANTEYDFSPLANLTNLSMLCIYDTPVDMLPIENYKNLTSLEVMYTGKDTSIFTYCKDTLKYLTLESPILEDYTFLSAFSKLKNFSISDIDTIEQFLPYLPNTVKSLELTALTNSDMKGLTSHTNLIGLYLSNMALNNNALSVLPATLEGLTIRNCTGLKDLTSISHLTNLTYLSFPSCWLKDISGITNLKNLEEVNGKNNCISDVSPFAQLPKLKHLELENNRIPDLTPLSSQLKNTPHFHISYERNPITDYTPLEGIKSYEKINFEETQSVIAAQKIVDAVITENMTDLEKYFSLAKALCETVTKHEKNSVYEALVNGKATYPGEYAEAYLLLCTVAGLPCYCVLGDYNGASYHSWNIVTVNGHCYNVDIYMMDKEDKTDITYFLKSDAYFKALSYAVTERAPDLCCDNTIKDN